MQQKLFAQGNPCHMKSPQAFEVVRASAGSGKTYRLVSRYLACCLVHDEPRAFRHILALTFTNKAAWEMKERILRDLARIGSGDKKADGLVEELEAQTNLPALTLRARARAMRSTMLHRYGDMAVMTLDSFTNRLVKSFARDLALDQDYRIELDQDRIVEEAVANVLDRVGAPGQEEFTEMLKGFARLQVEEEKDSRIRHPLTTYGREVLKEGMRSALEALSDFKASDFRKMSKDLRDEVRAVEAILKSVAAKATAAIDREGLTDKDVVRGTLFKWIRKQRQGQATAPSAALQAMFDEGVFTSKNAPDATVAAVGRMLPEAEAVRAQVARMTPGSAPGEAYLLRKRLVHKIDLVGTLAAIAEEMEDVQASRNVRTFHALHERIARVVRHNPVPFLFERMGSRFRHVFIDEFQDTSVTQWQNLIPLVDHVLSERNRALVVGDSKQAIYRWRNGDHRQLLELPNIVDDDEGAFADAARTFHDALDDQLLEANWRSGSAIVAWNGAFFEAVRRRLPGELAKVYEGHTQVPQQDFEGQIHIEAVCDKDRATREQLLNTALEARIRHHEEAGFRRSEMAILVRTNKQGAHIAQHLLDVGITPQTEDSLHLGRHPGALAVVALTRWVVDPSEDRHATAWLQCMAALSPGRIDESAVLDRHVSWRQNDEGRRFASLDALGMLKDLFPDLHPLERANGPLVAWVGHACQTLGLTGRFDAYAEALMEMAREVTGTEDGGLRGFLRVWDRTGSRRSIVASGGEDAVQIMTVHKAKGLAFPVTILVAGTNVAREVKGHLPVVLDPATGLDVPAALLRVSDMKDTALDGRAEAELDAALLDQINIVYVGMTRPIARLDVLAETAKLDFDREAPAQVGQWVLACAEDVADTRFESTGDCIARGAGGGLPERTAGSGVPTDALTTHLHLGEEVTQQVALAKGSHASVHPDGMDESALGTAVHSLLAEVNSTDTWPAVRAKFAAGWALSTRDRDKLLSWADAVLDRPESARFFQPGLRVECEPEWTDGVELYRPDRVVFDGQSWHIVDFKSGGQDRAKHIAQVQSYMQVLAGLEDAPIRGWLLYLEPWSLEEVPAPSAPLIFTT